MRAPHLNLVTNSRTVQQANVENVLRLWLEVVDLGLKDDAGISATALMMPRSKSTRLLLLSQDDDYGHCDTYDC